MPSARSRDWIVPAALIAAVLAVAVARGHGTGHPRPAQPSRGLLAVGLGQHGATDPTGAPVAIVLPVAAGQPGLVLESVAVRSRDFPVPRLIALRAAGATRCSGPVPVTSSGPGLFSSRGCGFTARDLRPLIGQQVPRYSRAHGPGSGSATTWPGMSMILEVTGPRPRQCWQITALAVRYRAGAAHHTVTAHGDIGVCRTWANPDLGRVSHSR